MLTYNKEININKVKEKVITQEIDKRIKELSTYGLSNEDINNVINYDYDIDIDSNNIDKMLINISICELLWYNNVYNCYQKYKNSLKKTLRLNNDIRTNTTEEKRYRNSFLSNMAVIFQKYGSELINDL